MKHKIGFVALTLLTAFSFFTSCDDEKDQFLDDYATIMYFNKSGERPVILYKTGESTNHEVIVNKGGSNIKATTEVTAELISETSLNIYNEMNGTNYTLLPSTCYNLDKSLKLSFSSNENQKKINVEFLTDEIDKLDKGINYVLPIELTNCKDSINSELNKVFINPEVIIPSINLETFGEQNIVDDPENTNKSTYTINAQMPLTNQWDFDCTLTVEPSLLDEFNANNESQWALLPQDAYQLTPTLSFVNGKNEAESTVVVDRSKIIPGDYILPIRMTECSNESFMIDEEKDVILIKISLKSVKLTTSMMTTNAQEPTEGPIANLVDGNTTTYFHSSWSVPASSLPHYFEIKLDNPVRSMKFQYNTRHNSGGQCPKKIVVKGSNDGTNFEMINTIDSGLPTSANTAYNSTLLKSEVAYSYLRFEVPVSVAGENVHFAMGEFKLWAE